MKENFKCAYSEIVPIHKLVENPKNNNRHPARQVELLAKVIDYQGQRNPIVVSKRSGFIVKGHCRLQALKLLGWENVAVDYQDYDNEAQEYADLIADNKIQSYAEFDEDELLKELQEMNFDDLELLALENMPVIEEREDEFNEEEIKPVEKKLLKCPVCGHINEEKAFKNYGEKHLLSSRPQKKKGK